MPPLKGKDIKRRYKRFHDCRLMLYLHDLLTESQNRMVIAKIEKWLEKETRKPPKDTGKLGLPASEEWRWV